MANIFKIVSGDEVIMATNVRLSEGLRPTRLVLRQLPNKFVTHIELLDIRVVENIIIAAHEGYDSGHYFDFGSHWPGARNHPTLARASSDVFDESLEEALLSPTRLLHETPKHLLDPDVVLFDQAPHASAKMFHCDIFARCNVQGTLEVGYTDHRLQ